MNNRFKRWLVIAAMVWFSLVVLFFVGMVFVLPHVAKPGSHWGK
jgi:hypothetical protein